MANEDIELTYHDTYGVSEEMWNKLPKPAKMALVLAYHYAAEANMAADTAKQAQAKAEAEAEALRKSSMSTIRLAVSEKGGLSLYGLGRFPITLYVGQWEKMLDYLKVPAESPARVFIEAHRSEFSVLTAEERAEMNATRAADRRTASPRTPMNGAAPHTTANGPVVTA